MSILVALLCVHAVYMQICHVGLVSIHNQNMNFLRKWIAGVETRLK